MKHRSFVASLLLLPVVSCFAGVIILSPDGTTPFQETVYLLDFEFEGKGWFWNRKRVKKEHAAVDKAIREVLEKEEPDYLWGSAKSGTDAASFIRPHYTDSRTVSVTARSPEQLQEVIQRKSELRERLMNPIAKIIRDVRTVRFLSTPRKTTVFVYHLSLTDSPPPPKAHERAASTSSYRRHKMGDYGSLDHARFLIDAAIESAFVKEGIKCTSGSSGVRCSGGDTQHVYSHYHHIDVRIVEQMQKIAIETTRRTANDQGWFSVTLRPGLYE